MNKYKYKLLGFTVTELVVGLSIGIVVLTGLMSFYFRSTRMISNQQTMAKNLSQLEFVLNKIVQDLKESNTQLPGTGTTITSAQWDAIPYMGYGRTYLDSLNTYQPPNNTYPKETPTYPVIYNFPVYQASKIGGPKDWYPKQSPITESQNLPRESNVMTFYKVKNNEIIRVIYYTEIQKPYTTGSVPQLKMYNLKRRTQYPPESTDIFLNSLGTRGEEATILSDLKFAQFTYPLITKKLADPPNPPNPVDPDYNVSTADPSLRNAMINIQTNEADLMTRYLKQSVLINEYRNIIKIRIATAGPQIGEGRPIALELSMEVTIRN